LELHGKTKWMVTQAQPLSPTERLNRRLEQNLADAERWRAEHGDPAEAMGAFLRDWIGLEALEATYHEYLRQEDSFLFDDYNEDDEDWGEDGRESD
jgi:hypothetical protein